jgi:uncharacterized protein YraI
VGTSLAQVQPPAVGPAEVADANAPNVAAFPYIAEVIGDDVYIRSGAGTNYYACGKINKGDKIKAVSMQYSWLCIVPPAGSFSWISMDYVSIDPDNPGTGIVTGDNVRVFAGSDNVRPIHSTSLQLKLNRGEKVQLLGEQKENYYKIAPPTGAYVWVSAKMTRPYVPPTVPPTTPAPVAEKAVADVNKPEPNEPATTTSPVTKPPVTPPMEAQRLSQYQELEKQMQAERAKPMEQQDYSKIKKALLEIANDKDAGKAARYADFSIKQIERFEFAFAVAKQIVLQEQEYAKVRQQIDKARQTRLSQVKDLGKFAVIGKLEVSNVYGSEPAVKRYQIKDATGNSICYAIATGAAVQADLSKLTGHKVGLVGTIEPNSLAGGALVRFSQAVAIE